MKTIFIKTKNKLEYKYEGFLLKDNNNNYFLYPLFHYYDSVEGVEE
jgi:hypothetical protein